MNFSVFHGLRLWFGERMDMFYRVAGSQVSPRLNRDIAVWYLATYIAFELTRVASLYDTILS